MRDLVFEGEGEKVSLLVELKRTREGKAKRERSQWTTSLDAILPRPEIHLCVPRDSRSASTSAFPRNATNAVRMATRRGSCCFGDKEVEAVSSLFDGTLQ